MAVKCVTIPCSRSSVRHFFLRLSLHPPSRIQPHTADWCLSWWLLFVSFSLSKWTTLLQLSGAEAGWEVQQKQKPGGCSLHLKMSSMFIPWLILTTSADLQLDKLFRTPEDKKFLPQVKYSQRKERFLSCSHLSTMLHLDINTPCPDLNDVNGQVKSC